MDPRMTTDMNSLRVLNDYLNQTIDVLVRQPRIGQASHAAFSPFSGIPATGAAIGTDTVYGPWLGGGMLPQTFSAHNPFTGLPLYGASYGAGFGAVDPFLAQRSFSPSYAPSFGPATFGGWQPSWSPIVEATRQAQVNQALAAKQSVLEAMCRACGIPV